MNKAVMMNTAIEITKAAAQGGHTQPWNVLKEVYAALKEINQNATRDDGDNS
jgi:head-tail adaptor